MAMVPGVLEDEHVYGGEMFYHFGGGLQFTISEMSEDMSEIAFSCIQSTCRRSALWHEDIGLRHTSPHDHLPNPLYPEVTLLKRRILYRVKNGDSAAYTKILEEESSR